MACKLNVQGKLPFLWNVSNKVGDTKDCTNQPTDVELVSVFLHYFDSKRLGTSPVGQSGITINGRFDVPTAYMIYNLQVTRKIEMGLNGVIVDGVISPARSDDHIKWTIAHLNHFMFRNDQNMFMGLGSDMRLSAQLRAELSAMRIG